jgi:glycosyltransferase involved in cell wall biosynthesis
MLDLRKPKISFVIPTYNCVAWLPLCVESLLNQTEQDIEVIVVNDCSTDGTKAFLDGYVKEKLRVFHNQKNMGAGWSRNFGAEQAMSDIIGVADADDVYINTHAENILKWFEKNPHSELVNFPYVTIDYFENIVEAHHGDKFDHEGHLKDGGINYFCNPSAAYKKSAMLEIGGYGYEKQGVITDDMQMIQKWIKAGKKVDFCGDDGEGNITFGVMHRILPNSMMSKLRGFDPKWLKSKEKV